MNKLDRDVFIVLFREACLKGFGFPLTSFLSEADSKLLSNKIFESTGLVIGPKSIKNYSLFVMSSKKDAAREENPSVSTLDTLARYVLGAPYTDEVKRKEKESHYPYWFEYRRSHSEKLPMRKSPDHHAAPTVRVIIAIMTIILSYFLIIYLTKRTKSEILSDNFNSVSADSLKSSGWIIANEDTVWWNKRNEKPGHLTLYTLKGDNWPEGTNQAGIKNLLMRRISSDCFATEIHITDFMPSQNWQQAGILISEDSTFRGKMIRLSISYNDFFGGYKRYPEILIQAVGSSPGAIQSKPEEIAHYSLTTIGPGQEELVRNNLSNTALKIEKRNNHFRFLYSSGPVESFAFKEVVSGDFNIKPRYVSIFAIQGWAENTKVIPVYFDSFSFSSIPCGN